MNCRYRLFFFLAFLLILSVVSSQFSKVYATQQVKLFGYVTDEENVTLNNSCVTVIFRDQHDAIFKNTQADENGYYELIVPYHTSYDFFVEGRECGDPYLFNYIPEWKTVSVGQSVDVRVDFKLRPGANIIIHAYDNNGGLLRNNDFREVTDGEAFATDPNNLPHYAVYHPIHDSHSISNGLKSNWDLAIPAFIVLPRTSYKIHVLWEVPEFGKVILTADNEGKDYSVDRQGGILTLNFNYEVAKSKVAMLQRDYDLLQSQGYSISSSVAQGLSLSKEHLRAAEGLMLQSSAPSMRGVVEQLSLSLKHSLWAHEQLYLDRAQVDIEKCRKGDVKIRVVDEEGAPLSSCSISFQQTGHDFVFSTTPYDPSYGELLKQAGINCTTSYFMYGDIEPKLRRFEWSWKDTEVDARLDDGLRLMGNLGWLFFRSWGDTRDTACPRYLDDMSFEEVKEAVYNHMYAIADRYKGKIDLWNAVYEACPGWSNQFNWTWNQKFEILRIATSAIKDANPEARILSKDDSLPYTRHMSWHCYKPADLNARAEWVPFLEFIALATEKQIPIDIIGLELPGSGVDFYQSGLPNVHPALDLVFISILLDQYSDFDKPIFLIDYHAPSTQVAGSCWWHRPWDEQTQAEYVKNVYTIAFSKPLVRGIDWGTGVTDGQQDEAGSRSCGLLDADLNPKQSYFELKNLISSWTTSGSGVTDEKGEFELRGFAGDYDVTLVSPDGHSCKTRIHISEQECKEITITLPTDQEDAECTILAVSAITPSEPAAFSVADLSIQPAQVEPNEPVTIMVSAANTGDTEGTYTILIKVNGVKEAEESVTLAPHSSQSVAFTVSKADAGSYLVDVNGLTSSFTVRPAAPPPAAPPSTAPPPAAMPPPGPPPVATRVNWAILGPIVGVAVFLAIFLPIRRRRGTA